MMTIVRSLKELVREPNSVVTVGTFDGVHRAHQEVISEVVSRAQQREGQSVAVTFEPHPKEVVQSARGPVRLLSTLAERIERLRDLQLGVLFVVDFTYAFSRLTSREFYEQYVVRGVGVSEVVVGYDHTFGRDREGDTRDLLRMGREFDFSVFAVHPLSVDGEVVSSTKIRRALAEGNLDRARRLLGYDYTVTGRVVPGDGRGKSLGFATANIQPVSDRKQLPANGVYVVGVRVQGQQKFGMLNIGVVPTFTSGSKQVIEVHIFDFSQDLYGEELTVTFLKRLRDEEKFSSADDLVRQMQQDREVSLNYVSALAGSTKK